MKIIKNLLLLYTVCIFSSLFVCLYFFMSFNSIQFSELILSEYIYILTIIIPIISLIYNLYIMMIYNKDDELGKLLVIYVSIVSSFPLPTLIQEKVGEPNNLFQSIFALIMIIITIIVILKHNSRI